MKPDQTGPPKVQSDLGPYCLLYRPRTLSRQKEQTTKVVTRWLKVKLIYSSNMHVHVSTGATSPIICIWLET